MPARGLRGALAAMMLVVIASPHLHGGQIDIDRALAIARSSERERAQFHAPYITVLPGEVSAEYFRLEKLEVITEFRRMVLIGEQQLSLGNHTFGRGGTRDAREALQPWADRVSLVVHLRFAPTMHVITGVPELEVILDGATPARPFALTPTTIYKGYVLVGGTLEAAFSPRETDGRREVVIRWKGTALYRTVIDFGQLP